MLKWVDETRCRRRTSLETIDDSTLVSSFCSESSSGLGQAPNLSNRLRTARPQSMSVITIQPLTKGSPKEKNPYSRSLSTPFRRTKQFTSVISSGWIVAPPQPQLTKEDQNQSKSIKPTAFRFSLLGRSKSCEDITSPEDEHWSSEYNNKKTLGKQSAPSTPELSIFKHPLRQVRRQNCRTSKSHIKIDLKTAEVNKSTLSDKSISDTTKHVPALTSTDTKCEDVNIPDDEAAKSTPKWYRPQSPSANRQTERTTLKQIRRKSENVKPKLFSPNSPPDMSYSQRRSASASESSTWSVDS